MTAESERIVLERSRFHDGSVSPWIARLPLNDGDGKFEHLTVVPLAALLEAQHEIARLKEQVAKMREALVKIYKANDLIDHWESIRQIIEAALAATEEKP